MIAPRQHAAVNARVQRLDATAEHLGAAGQRLHVDHLEPPFAQRPGGTAGGHELDAQLGQAAGEVDQALLVGNGQQRPAYRTLLLGGHRALLADGAGLEIRAGERMCNEAR